MIRLSHRGICVSDVERSRAFYTSALGFIDAQDPGLLSGADMEQTMELPPGVRVHAPMLSLPGGPTIELLHFLQPPAHGPREAHPFESFGLHHLAFTVSDIDSAADRIEAAGGTAMRDTRVEVTEPDGAVRRMLYCTDPDGVRIQLLWFPGVADGFSHSGICVSDADTTALYYEALGFRTTSDWRSDPATPWLDTHTRIPDMVMRARFLTDPEGNTLELLTVGSGSPCEGRGRPDRTPINRFGLTHLAFWADDPRTVVSTLTELQGYFVEAAHVRLEQVELHHGADPDGVRIELMTPTV